jgi:hypothetical protein
MEPEPIIAAIDVREAITWLVVLVPLAVVGWLVRRSLLRRLERRARN